MIRNTVGPLLIEPSEGYGSPIGLGTCCVIGSYKGTTIAVTAAHCITGAFNEDVPRTASLQNNHLNQNERVLYRFNKRRVTTNFSHADCPFFMSLPCSLVAAFTSDTNQSDIAYLLIQPDEDYKGLVIKDRVPVLLSQLTEGEVALATGFWCTEVSGSHRRNGDRRHALIRTSGRFEQAKTKVVSINEERISLTPGITATIDTPIYSGMSGGALFVERQGKMAIAAVCSSDMADDEHSATGTHAITSVLGAALSCEIKNVYLASEASDDFAFDTFGELIEQSDVIAV